MVFAYPLCLWLILLIPIPWLVSGGRAYVGHTRVLPAQRSFSKYLHLLPVLLIGAGFALFFIALARPQHPYTMPDLTTRARDIVIAVDKSGSMSTEFDGVVPTPIAGNTALDKELPPLPPLPSLGDSDNYGYGVKDGHRRIDAAQASALNFVRDRFVLNSGDRLGVLVFDTQPYWAWPITKDLKIIYRELQINVTVPGGGTNFGSTDPGPIDAAVQQFQELGQSNTRVVIMITDGEDSLNSSFDRVLNVLNSNGVRLYVIGVGPYLARNDVDITRLAQAAGGRVFRVENAGDLNECFKTINSLEQSPVRVPGARGRDELFWYFAIPALVFFLLGAFAEAVVLKQ
jgi:hypothetical protein